MPDKLNAVPAFVSEDEELAFWDEHDPEEFDDGPADDVIWDLRRPEPKQRINLRLEPALIAELKLAAADHHIPYQTLARGLIRKGLHQLKAAG